MPINLPEVTSGYNLSLINDNFQTIESKWDEKLDRLSNSHGNQMEVELDMNSNKIINHPPTDLEEPTDLVRVDALNQFADFTGTVPTVASYVGDGTTVAFPKPVNANDARTFQVYVGGLRQEPYTDYQIVGEAVVFTQAPVLDVSVDIYGYSPTIIENGAPVYAEPILANFTGNGTTTNFFVSAHGSGTDSAFISIDGVNQVPNVDFTNAGGAISFTEAPPLNSEIFVRIFAPFTNNATDSVVTATGSTHPRTLGDRFADSVSVLDFGAVGDGTTDNLGVFQTIRDAYPNGASLSFPTGQTFYCSAGVAFTGEWFIEGNGSTILLGTSAFSFSNPSFASHTLTVDANNSYFQSGNVGAERGDLFAIRCDTLWRHDNRGSLVYGELNQIAEVSANGNIHVGSDEYNGLLVFPEEYTVAANTVVDYYKNRTLRIQDLEFRGVEDNASSALVVSGYSSPVLDNVSIADCNATGSSISYCFNPDIRNFRASNISPAGGTGYGVQFNACRNATVNASSFHACRRGVDYSGLFPSIGGGVYGSYADGCGGNTGSAFGTHGTAYNITFDGNTLGSNQYGFVARGENINITNNNADFCNINFVHATHGAGLVCSGNKIRRTQRLLGLYADYINYGNDPSILTMGKTIVSNNRVDQNTAVLVGFEITATQKDLYGYVIERNVVGMASAGTYRSAISAINLGDNLSGFTFNNGSSIRRNTIVGDVTTAGRYSGIIDQSVMFDGLVSASSIRVQQLSSTVLEKQTGTGDVSNFDIKYSLLDINSGLVSGEAIFTFDVSGGNVNGVKLVGDWIKRPHTFSEGRFNPLYYQVGFSDSLGFAQARVDGELYIGYGTTGIDTSLLDGSYIMSLQIQTVNTDASGQRPQ